MRSPDSGPARRIDRFLTASRPAAVRAGRAAAAAAPGRAGGGFEGGQAEGNEDSFRLELGIGVLGR